MAHTKSETMAMLLNYDTVQLERLKVQLEIAGTLHDGGFLSHQEYGQTINRMLEEMVERPKPS